MIYRSVVCRRRLLDGLTRRRSRQAIADRRQQISAEAKTGADAVVQTPDEQHGGVQPRERRDDRGGAKLEEVCTATAAAAAVAAIPATPKANGRAQRRGTRIDRPALRAASEHHNDLASFLSYADRNGLSPTTAVYKGTHYEYTVAEALKQFGFTLHRTGRSNDLGIDLIGHWKISGETLARPGSGPSLSRSASQEIPILVQCKAVKPQPSMIRELDGAYVGAPAGWRSEGVIALLVATEPATKGVREAMQRSNSPVGVLQLTRSGRVLQFLWNAASARNGLEGLGVTVRYGTEGSDGESAGRSHVLALTWLGKMLKPSRG